MASKRLPEPPRTMLFGLALAAVQLLLSGIQLPGNGKDFLAICTVPSCRWRDFVTRIDQYECCRAHGVQNSQPAPVNRLIRVRCFYGNCPNDSPLFTYVPGLHNSSNIRCEEHQRQ